MEVSGVAFRRVPCLSGAVIDAHSAKPSVSVGPSEFRVLGYGDSRAFTRPRKSYGALMINSGFCDNGHLQYYYAGPRCGGKKEKEKEKEKAVTAKKKLKLLKGLTKDLSKFSDMGFGVDSDDDLAAQAQRKAMSDAAEVLMKQLQHLRAEDDLKRKRKQETSKLDCESSSSESSDSECEEVIDMSCLRSEPHEEPVQLDELQSATQENATTLTLSSWLTEEGNTTEANGLGDCRSENNEVECCTKISTSFSSSNVGHNDISSIATGAQRIEVCMGKKCKKSGGPALLEEFGRVIGVEGAVVECKCLGKCKDGPNVRVLNCADGSQAEGLDVSVMAPTNPLVIGVALEDVGAIVSNFFGDDQKDLAAAVQ